MWYGRYTVWEHKLILKKSDHGCTPLFVACKEGHTSSINLLHFCGADINISNEDGVTPLLKATMTGDLEIIRALHKLGADMNQFCLAA